jgi:hypothetical protein
MIRAVPVTQSASTAVGEEYVRQYKKMEISGGMTGNIEITTTLNHESEVLDAQPKPWRTMKRESWHRVSAQRLILGEDNEMDPEPYKPLQS